jgi:hypothetical protein
LGLRAGPPTSTPSGEGTFIKSLINDPELQRSVESQRAHRPTGDVVARLLNVAAAIFQTPTYTATDVRTTNPSFNFADIFKLGKRDDLRHGPVRSLHAVRNSGLPGSADRILRRTVFDDVTGVRALRRRHFLLSTSVAGNETLQLLNGTVGRSRRAVDFVCDSAGKVGNQGIVTTRETRAGLLLPATEPREES